MNPIRTANLKALGTRYPELAASMARRDDGIAPEGVNTEDPANDPGNARNIIVAGLAGHKRWTGHIDRRLNEANLVILLEPDAETFSRLLNTVSLARYVENPKVHIIATLPRERLFGRMREALSSTRAFLSVLSTSLIASGPDFGPNPEYLKKALTDYRDAAMDLLYSVGNSPHDSYLGIMHMLGNLETIAREPGVKGLFGAFRGKPAIIVSAGPSLDKNVHRLKSVGDRAIIFSVDAILKTLVNMDVSVDFATVLERVNFSPLLFKEIPPEKLAETVQISVPVVVPEVYSVYPGPKALMYRPYAHFEWLENEKGTLETGASSANMAFKLAEAFGCDPIILVGQDLSYGRAGTTHSDGVPWGRSQARNLATNPGNFLVPANGGGQVVTNKTWNMFRLAFEGDIKNFRGTVINATEGGALINGTRVTTLKDAINRHMGESFPKKAMIKEHLPRPGEEKARAYLERITGERIPETISRIKSYSAGALALGGLIAAELQKASPDARGDLGEKINKIYWELTIDATLRQSLFHVTQPEIVRTLLIGNKLEHTGAGGAEILRHHAETMKRLVAMSDKVAQLYENLRESSAINRFGHNIEILKGIAPELAAKAALGGPPARLTGNGERPAKRETLGAAPPKDLAIILGADDSPGFIERLHSQTSQGGAVVLVERDLERFRRFLKAVNLEKITLKAAFWPLVGDINPRPLIAAQTMPPPQVFTSLGFSAIIKDTEGYRENHAENEETLKLLLEDLSARAEIAGAGNGAEFMARMLATAPRTYETPVVALLRDFGKGFPALSCLDETSAEEAKLLARLAPPGLFIIATEKASVTLHAEGVTPHIIVAMRDPKALGLTGGHPEDAVVAHVSYCEKGLWEAPVARRALITHPPHFYKWLDQATPTHPFSGSNTQILALEMADLLGAGLSLAIGCPGARWDASQDAGTKWRQIIFARAMKGRTAITAKADLEARLLEAASSTPIDRAALTRLLSRPDDEEINLAAEKLKEKLLLPLLSKVEKKLALTCEHIEECGSAPEIMPPGQTWYERRLLERGTYGWETPGLTTDAWHGYLKTFHDLRGREADGEDVRQLQVDAYLAFIDNVKTKLTYARDFLRGARRDGLFDRLRDRRAGA